MVRRNGPRRRRENELRTHQAKSTREGKVRSKRVGANHQADASERCVCDGKAITKGIKVVSDGEFVDFAMVENDVAGGADQDGGVEDSVSGTFDDTRTDVGASLLRERSELPASLATGNFVGERACTWLHPAEWKCFRQQNDVRAGFGSGVNEASSAGDVLITSAGLEVDLSESELERTGVQGSSLISLPLSSMVFSMRGGRDWFNSTCSSREASSGRSSVRVAEPMKPPSVWRP